MFVEVFCVNMSRVSLYFALADFLHLGKGLEFPP